MVGFQLAWEGLGDVTLLERCVLEIGLEVSEESRHPPPPCVSLSFLLVDQSMNSQTLSVSAPCPCSTVMDSYPLKPQAHPNTFFINCLCHSVL